MVYMKKEQLGTPKTKLVSSNEAKNLFETQDNKYVFALYENTSFENFVLV